ncbi:MAG: DUF6573 family protein [Polyangiaceae bacterium]
MNAHLNPQPDPLEPVRRLTQAPNLDDERPVDVSDAAREAGLRIPVSLSRDAWKVCVALSPAARSAGCCERTRLSDVLATLAWAMERSHAGHPVSFEVPCITRGARPTCVPLRAVPESSDGAVTLVLPEELS